jgi:hypothetical protein
MSATMRIAADSSKSPKIIGTPPERRRNCDDKNLFLGIRYGQRKKKVYDLWYGTRKALP